MLRRFTIGVTATFLSTIPAMSQQPAGRADSAPMYRVTVIQRHVDAINYQYRSGPTRLNFEGTVLMSGASGDATVESQRGRTEITAKFDRVLAPSRFGGEYLTYVLWAISPEGSPHNLGEVVPNGSNHATLHVTTDLQAFGLIVTAEPYSAVRAPSDVVVLENVVRPDTIGRIQPIRAKYELMPRGQYTWNVQQQDAKPNANAPKVSMREYEAISQVYQAQNAVEMARAANVAQLAPTTFSEAERLLAEARRLQASKADTSLIIQNARAAAQTAEDARLIAERRAHEQQLAEARNAAAAAEQAKAQAQAEAQRVKAEADAARASTETQRVAREQAEAAAATQAPEAPPSRSDDANSGTQPQGDDAAQKTQKRMRLMEELNRVIVARDTPRGLVITIPDDGFNGSDLRPRYADRLMRVAGIMSKESDLRLEVEGHTDSTSSEALSSGRASQVRDALVRGGLTSSSIPARGLGASRLLTSNATESGRMTNRRVEIVISGGSIGVAPSWSQSYKLTAR